MKEFSLKPSEIRKANKYATAKNGVKCEVTGYSFGAMDAMGYMDVTCEMCTVEDGRRVNDVVMCCLMRDRRRSFATDFVPEF